MTDTLLSPASGIATRALLRRDLQPAAWQAIPDEYNQIAGFFGETLPASASYWSKAGETSAVCHDAAWVQATDRPTYLLVAFTNGQRPRQLGVLPWLSAAVFDTVGQL